MTSVNKLKLSAEEESALRRLHSTFPLNVLPEQLRPFAELVRISKPAGTAMFYFPLLYGSFLIGSLSNELHAHKLFTTNFQLLLLAFVMRGALCTWNDMLDQELDRQVTRTRIRPLARYAVSTSASTVFLAMQIALLTACFWTLPPRCATYAIPCLILHIIYPLAKRVTHHPQVILGLAFSNGILIAFPALGYDITSYKRHDPRLLSVIGLTLAIVFWTVLFDTIYAAQDLDDDKKIGIGSTMVFWEGRAKDFIRALAALTVAALSMVSYPLAHTSLRGSAIYTIISCIGSAVSLLWMVETVELENPASCGWWFGVGSIRVGLLVGCGLIGACLVQLQ